MDYYLERLESELRKILSFWTKNIISTESENLNYEFFADGSQGNQTIKSSLFLGRVLYGASAASRFLNSNDYKLLADLAFKELYEKYKNPAGGYFWGFDNENKATHNENIIIAQTNVLYGICEYALLNKNQIARTEADKLYSFITHATKDSEKFGFIDNFSIDWNKLSDNTRNLSTHLGMLVAFLKYYEIKEKEEVFNEILSLVSVMSEKFINQEKAICYSTLSTDGSILSEELSTGTYSQIAWILISASRVINDSDLITNICSLSKALMEKTLSTAFDKQYGGVFDFIQQNKSLNKSWWPQAETAIASLQTYNCSKDKTYLSYAIRLIEYIENTFSDDEHGEWYAEISQDGTPNYSIPKIHLWKSLYHNVRYCIEVSSVLRELISRQS